MSRETDVRIAPGELTALATRVFAAAGVPDDVAVEVAEHLVASNLAGHDSHGVIRVRWYVEQIRAGWLRPSARPVVVRETPAAGLVSGEWGFGHPAARLAMDLAVERAREHGLGAAGLIRATHLGRLGTYTERATGLGCVALMWLGGLGTHRASVPHGGARPLYGTNPISFGFPAGDEGPALLDYATTQIAGGKVMVAQDRGVELPPGCIVDRDGRPSTRPEDFFDGGAILPFGGHKGYAQAFFAQLLGQCLTGAELTGDEGFGGGHFDRSGSFFLAIDPGLFRPASETIAAADRFLDEARSVPPAPGFERVMAPGDPERRAREQRRLELVLPWATMESIQRTARELGLS
jgi:LDH2 family malate/lactate/ureidoglycolate dehydrogenase